MSGLVAVVFACGCASVANVDPARNEAAKKFTTRPDMGNVYVYRPGRLGTAYRFPVVMDGKILGDLTARTFVLTTVAPGPHTLQVVVGGKPEVRQIAVQGGRNFFVKVTTKMGFTSPRFEVEVMQDEKEAMSDLDDCTLIQF